MINALEIGNSSGHSQPVLSDLLQTNVEKVANGKAHYSYEATLKAAQQVNWRIEDIIGGKRGIHGSGDQRSWLIGGNQQRLLVS